MKSKLVLILFIGFFFSACDKGGSSFPETDSQPKLPDSIGPSQQCLKLAELLVGLKNPTRRSVVDALVNEGLSANDLSPRTISCLDKLILVNCEGPCTIKRRN